jgi:hypothetical protein
MTAALLFLLSSAATADDCGKYSRKLFKHWVDEDHNGLNTNHDVLKAESRDPAVVTNGRVVSGRWIDPYTGQVYTKPSDWRHVYLDVDHVVSLGEAWRWGACRWDAAKRQRYANYLGVPYHLTAVQSSANRAKGDRGVADGWLPDQHRCEYLVTRMTIWRDPQWGFSVPQAEVDATLDAIGKYCPKLP